LVLKLFKKLFKIQSMVSKKRNILQITRQQGMAPIPQLEAERIS
jgi:hypothetical protein